MSNPFTRRRCWGLTALPFTGVGATALIESLGVSQTGLIRAVLYLGFVAVLVGSGAAFLAWGRRFQFDGRPQVGTALERGVGIVFTVWIGWALLAELTNALPHSLAVLEALVIGTSFLVDGYLLLLLTRFDVGQTDRDAGHTVSGLLYGTVLLAFSVLWQRFSQRWTATNLLALVIAVGILGFQIVRLERRTNHDSPPSAN